MQVLKQRYVQLLCFKHSLLKHKCYQNSLGNTNEKKTQTKMDTPMQSLQRRYVQLLCFKPLLGNTIINS